MQYEKIKKNNNKKKQNKKNSLPIITRPEISKRQKFVLS